MSTRRYDYLIVGAGLTGSVIARELTDAGYKCLVIEKRDHVGGNLYDEVINGINVHKYGPHIFHTNSKKIWNYVNRFSKWIPYEHRVKAVFGEKVYSFPPNMLTYQQIGISHQDPRLKEIIFDMFFRGYSIKQWGRRVEDIPASILKRIPIRFDYDDRYFSDIYQALPKNGYSNFIKNVLFNIDVELEHSEQFLSWPGGGKIIYTGKPDACFDYVYGKLDYRSLRFITKTSKTEKYGAASFNYTDSVPDYTRVHNWKYFGYQSTKNNVITWEYPCLLDVNSDPFYPIEDVKNKVVYKQYAALAKEAGVVLAGRLGKYKYLNMDQAIASAMSVVKKILS